MVMVANKKSQEQMTEDLSLFLGNNTVRFTVWYVYCLFNYMTISEVQSTVLNPWS